MFGAALVLTIIACVGFVALSTIRALETDEISDLPLAFFSVATGVICIWFSFTMYDHATNQAHFELRPTKDGNGVEWVGVAGPASRPN